LLFSLAHKCRGDALSNPEFDGDDGNSPFALGNRSKIWSRIASNQIGADVWFTLPGLRGPRPQHNDSPEAVNFSTNVIEFTPGRGSLWHVLAAVAGRSPGTRPGCTGRWPRDRMRSMSVRAREPGPEFWDTVAAAGPPLAVAATYLFACKQLVDLIGTGAGTPTRPEQTVLWGLLWLIGGSYLITTGVLRGFRPQSRGRMLLSIATSYVALIVVFAGFNYVLCAIGDKAQTVAVARQYARWVVDKTQQPTSIDLRAFRGVESLWTGVDAYLPNSGLDGWKPDDYLNAFNAAAAAGPTSIEPTFKPESRLAAFLDCVHFSIATMTTTGYGDIVPNQFYSKLAADVQILAGVAVVVFALGMAFGGWWRRDPLDELRERLSFGEIGFREPFWQDLPYGVPNRGAPPAVRQSAPPICPRCGSQHAMSFAELGFPAPGEPPNYDPRESKIFFLLILSVATWLVYSFIVPQFLGMLPILGQRIAALPLIATVAMMIQLPLSLLAQRVRRRLERLWRKAHDRALARYSKSWSCEACRNIFATD
jgi:hypothetical protein